jgi:hypothetical protein
VDDETLLHESLHYSMDKAAHVKLVGVVTFLMVSWVRRDLLLYQGTTSETLDPQGSKGGVSLASLPF